MNRQSVDWLRNELPALVEAGILDPSAADRLRDHYAARSRSPSPRAYHFQRSWFASRRRRRHPPYRLQLASALPSPPRGPVLRAPFSSAKASSDSCSSADPIRSPGAKAPRHSSPSLSRHPSPWSARPITSPATFALSYSRAPSSSPQSFTSAAPPSPPSSTLPRLPPGRATGPPGDAPPSIISPSGRFFSSPCPTSLTSLRRAPYAQASVLLSWALSAALALGLGFTLERAWPGIWIPVYSALFAVFFLTGARWFSSMEQAWRQPFYSVGWLGLAVLSIAFTFESAWREVGWSYYRVDPGRAIWMTALDFVIAGGLLSASTSLLVLGWRKLSSQPLLSSASCRSSRRSATSSPASAASGSSVRSSSMSTCSRSAFSRSQKESADSALPRSTPAF